MGWSDTWTALPPPDRGISPALVATSLLDRTALATSRAATTSENALQARTSRERVGRLLKRMAATCQRPHLSMAMPLRPMVDHLENSMDILTSNAVPASHRWLRMPWAARMSKVQLLPPMADETIPWASLAISQAAMQLPHLRLRFTVSNFLLPTLPLRTIPPPRTGSVPRRVICCNNPSRVTRLDMDTHLI